METTERYHNLIGLIPKVIKLFITHLYHPRRVVQVRSIHRVFVPGPSSLPNATPTLDSGTHNMGK